MGVRMSRRDEDSVQPESEGQRARDRLRELADFDLPGVEALKLGWLAVLVYSLGFLVVTQHVTRFGIPSYELLRVRYASAGILLIVFLAPPVLTGLVFWREWSSLEGKAIGAERAIVPSVVSLVVGFFIWRFLPAFLSVDGAPPPPYSFAWFLGVSLISATAMIFYRDQALARQRTGMRHLLRATTVAVFGLVAVHYFTRQIFPTISPGFGGGAGIVARIVPAADPSLGLDAVFREPIIVVDRTSVALLVISDTTVGRRFEVPYQQVVGIETFGEVPLPQGALW